MGADIPCAPCSNVLGVRFNASSMKSQKLRMALAQRKSYTQEMVFRLVALFLIFLGFVLGVIIVISTGADSLIKQVLGISIPTSLSFGIAFAWWRKAT